MTSTSSSCCRHRANSQEVWRSNTPCHSEMSYLRSSGLMVQVENVATWFTWRSYHNRWKIWLSKSPKKHRNLHRYQRTCPWTAQQDRTNTTGRQEYGLSWNYFAVPPILCWWWSSCTRTSVDRWNSMVVNRSSFSSLTARSNVVSWQRLSSISSSACCART